MSDHLPWTVYASSPPPVTCHSERAANRLGRKYARLGMRVSLYSPGPDGELVQRLVFGAPGVVPSPADHETPEGERDR